MNVEYLEEEYGRSILKEGGVNYHDLSNDPRTKPETTAKVESILIPVPFELFLPVLNKFSDQGSTNPSTIIRMSLEIWFA